MSVDKKTRKAVFLTAETSTSTRTEHVGELKHAENEVSESGNDDVKEDGACR